MTFMGEFGRRGKLIWPVMLALLCGAACSRPAGVPTSGSAQENATPFRPESDESETAAAKATEAPQRGLPFHDSDTLPAGTLVTVRLKGAVTAGTSITANSFAAIVDQPVVVDGSTLIPRGTMAAGRIESARISSVKPNRAYVRLALESLHLAGVDVPVQTSSLFTRQNPQGDDLIRLEDGRRLTFRLTESVPLTTQRAEMGR
jgi:hypothetical protein